MDIFELVIALLTAGVLLTILARRLRVPDPALLALAGACIAVIPGMPAVALDPGLALALFVAPTLLDAAYDASPRDLRDNLVPLASLAVAAVAVTVAAVAVVVTQLAPDVPWPAAVALGAIVAPPDAAAAMAVLGRLELPSRMTTILQGESLLNDASALLIYRLAVGAATGHAVGPAAAVPLLLVDCGGAVLLGFVLSRLSMAIMPLIKDLAVNVLMQFISTFIVWLLADRLGVSAVITMVAYAMFVARRAPERSDARRRIASYAVWEVTVFVLNVLAFILIGLQVRAILPRMSAPGLTVALAVCATVVVVRLAWVIGFTSLVSWKNRRFGVRQRRAMGLPSPRGGLIIGWCGMRGIVTLAAALALPEGFPARDLLVLSAFAVTLVTLVVQGMTLGPLVRAIGLVDDGAVLRETALARVETTRAALAALESGGVARASTHAQRALEAEYAARLAAAQAAPTDPAGTDLQRAAVAAQRRELGALRRRGTIGEEAFHAIEEEIDLLELAADPRVRAFLPHGVPHGVPHGAAEAAADGAPTDGAGAHGGA